MFADLLNLCEHHNEYTKPVMTKYKDEANPGSTITYESPLLRPRHSSSQGGGGGAGGVAGAAAPPPRPPATKPGVGGGGGGLGGGPPPPSIPARGFETKRASTAKSCIKRFLDDGDLNLDHPTAELPKEIERGKCSSASASSGGRWGG